jgi:hydrogenase nickel incorporation protein HypB
VCATCGCSGTATVRLIGPHERGSRPHGPHDHPVHEHAGWSQGSHDHGAHDHSDHDQEAPGHGPHDHDPAGPGQDRTVMLQQKVLAKNDKIAEQNRDWLRERGVLAVNVMSSPGAGKTTLLERTIQDLAGGLLICVIEGDQETALDASRIEASGCRVVQINTGAGCHLDAEMVADGLRVLDPPSGSIVVIENVGNLVCPALFDLGEQAKVVVASVTEGADKPVKYPHMFRQANLVLVTKVDLLPYVNFDIQRYTSDLRKVTPQAMMLQLSATTGQGMDGWYDWLRRRAPAPREERG